MAVPSASREDVGLDGLLGSDPGEAPLSGEVPVVPVSGSGASKRSVSDRRYRRDVYRGASARRTRRGLAIHAYVGWNGGGKSLAMIYDTLPDLASGVPVLSTVRLLDFENPRPCEGCNDPEHVKGHLQAHPLYIPFRRFPDFVEFAALDTPGVVLMDEVQGIASSREHSQLPFQVAKLLHELRRGDIALRWSAVSWKRADTVVREATLGVTFCVGMLPKARIMGGIQRMWRDRRLFLWRTYDKSAFDEWENKRRNDVKPVGYQWYWGPGSVAFTAYDTLAPVTALGWANEAGMCVTCGGRRRAPQCRCEAPPGGESGGPQASASAGDGASIAVGRRARSRTRSASAVGVR